jgi:hypothetical protein
VHSAHALILSLVCVGALSASCKQQSKEDLGPDPVVTAAPVAAPTPTQSVAPPPETVIPPPTPPPPAASVPAATKTPDKGADAQAVKTCCAALRQEQTQVPESNQGTYRSAASSCDAILKLVAAGTTSRTSAFASIRAALKGGKLPASCR